MLTLTVVIHSVDCQQSVELCTQLAHMRLPILLETLLALKDEELAITTQTWVSACAVGECRQSYRGIHSSCMRSATA